jgi:hypothetical protein
MNYCAYIIYNIMFCAKNDRQSSILCIYYVHYRVHTVCTLYNQTYLLLGLLFDGSQGLGISEIVDGDSQEHVQENICIAIFVKD